jgi:S-formylglutathione hydrolase
MSRSGPERDWPTSLSLIRNRLVKGADHVGASLVPRSLDAFAFIGRQLNPPKWIDDTVLRFRDSADHNKKARGYPVTPFDPNRIHKE